MSKLNSGTFVFNLQPISSTLVRAGKLREGNALGLGEQTQMWLEFGTGWLMQEDDLAAYDASREVMHFVEDAARRSGEYLDYQFMNDASGDQDVIGHYGNESLARLRDVQRKYDPHAIFRSLVKGGFKIPK